ncbi:invasin domain 3-containing protein [Rhodohalobacter sp. 614A]|uniref:invasin domain 3-containing protein n=1 Tax=Rhodohalobacter sp. 614A TaxID=2908649 RepID=UPI001F445707|nr:invasin domain 3-containing protein [Rhodohalobacter sp. 614A]
MMRKNTTFIFGLLLIFIISENAVSQTRQEIVNIGNDNETTVAGPSYTGLISVSLSGEYQFETLYLSDEIDLTTDAELTAIEFYVTGGLSVDLLNNTEFYLKTTNQSSLSDGNISNPEDAGYTAVEGSFSQLGLSLDDGDIVRFELDDGFPLDQGDNLAIHTRGGALLDVTLGENFYATSTGSDNLTKASDFSLLPIPGWGAMETTSLRPNVRLEFESDFQVSASNSVITVQRDELPANGSSTTLVNLQVRTTTGENVNSGGDNVQFSTSRGSINSANDNGDGTYTATLTSSNSPGEATISATLNGSNVGDQASVDFVESLSQLYCTDLENDVIQIGTPTSSSTTSYGPLYNNLVSLTLGTYQFETIFLQNELGIDQPGFLNSIEFFVTDDINVEALENFQIYVKETSQDDLSDGYVELDGYTFVGGNGALANVTLSGQGRLRIEFETPFYYSGNGNIAIHTRYVVLADVNVGGDFNYDSADNDLTKASDDFLNILGITAGLTPPERTSQRPVVSFDFDLMTSPSLSESTLSADPNSIPANGSSMSAITSIIRKSDGSVCVLEAGTPEFETNAGSLGGVTDEGDGEYTIPLTSSTTPEIATVQALLAGNYIDDEAEVEFFQDTFPPSPSFTIIQANPGSIAADGTSTSEITVTLRDENDDPVTNGGFEVNLSVTMGSLGEVIDNGDGTYTATLTSSTTPGVAEISGTLDGDSIDDTAEVEFTVLPPSAAFTTITASPNEILADGSSTSNITVTLRNSNDDPVSSGGFTVNLSTTAGSLSEVTDNGDGTYSAILTSSTNEETAIISGSLEGEEIDDTAEVTFQEEIQEPDPQFTQIEVNPDELPADGESQAMVTVTLRDENDDPVSAGGYCSNVDISTTGGSLGDVIDNGDGTCTLPLTAANDPGMAEITGTYNGDNIEDSASIEFTALPPSAEFTTIAASPQNIMADGASTSDITVTLRNENDEPVNEGGFTVTLSTTAGSLSSVTDNEDGTYSAILTSSTNEETATISGSLEGEDIEDTAQVNFKAEILEPSPQFTEINVNPNELPADGESQATVTVFLKDENDDPITDGGYCERVEVSTTDGILGEISDNGDGTCTLPLTSGEEPGTAEISGQIDGEDIEDTAVINFTALPPSAEFTRITASPNNIVADGSSTSDITVTLRNENDEPVEIGGFEVNLSTDAGSLSGVTDNGDGTYSAILTSSINEEKATITGSLEGDDIEDTAEVNFVAELQEPSAEFTEIEADPEEIPADGESESTITITLRDENDDPITEGGYCDLVDISASAGMLDEIVDNGDGTCALILTSDDEAGTAQIGGTINGDTIGDTAEVEFTELQPSITFTTIQAKPNKILADGSSTSTITVTLRDENDNRITNGGVNVDLTTTAGSLSGITDNGDGTFTAMLTSSIDEETAIVRGTLEGDDINDTAEVQFVLEVLPPDGEFTTIIANPVSIKANGESTSTITVILRDENDEPVGQGGYNVTLSTTAGLLGEIIDEGDGTYTAILTSENRIATATISGMAEGENIDDTATVDFVQEVLPPDAAFTLITAEPTQIAADGESTSQIQVTLKNRDDEPVGEGGFDVNLTTNAGTLSNVIDNGDGTYKAVLTSSTIVETATISGTLQEQNIDDTASVEFIFDETEPHPDFIVIRAEPSEIPADGVSTARIVVTMYNSNGEIVSDDINKENLDLSTTMGDLDDEIREGNNDGVYWTEIVAPENPGMAMVTATFNDEQVDDHATVRFIALEEFACSVESVYPNPFLNNATFRITSPAAGKARLDLFNILGKKVSTILDEEVTAGEHDFMMDGSHLSSGVYIYRYQCPCTDCEPISGQVTHMGRD